MRLADDGIDKTKGHRARGRSEPAQESLHL